MFPSSPDESQRASYTNYVDAHAKRQRRCTRYTGLFEPVAEHRIDRRDRERDDGAL